MLRHHAFIATILLAFLAGCAGRPPTTGITPLRPASLADLHAHLLRNKPDLEQFRLRGPFGVTVREDHEVRLSGSERITMDAYLTSPGEPAPLVIFLHGHEATKNAHAYQAMHAASWGMHCVSVQLSGTGPWVANGKALARLVAAIRRSPEMIDRRVDVNRIVLIGHSFGAAAVAVALVEGAPALGGILLDPAYLSRELPGYLKKVNKPIMVVGADEQVFTARNRNYFHRYINRGFAEVSVRNATHEDAQFPSQSSLQIFGLDYSTSEELQLTFVSALTSAAFSLAATGKFDYAWTSFGDALESGKFVNARKK